MPVHIVVIHRRLVLSDLFQRRSTWSRSSRLRLDMFGGSVLIASVSVLLLLSSQCASFACDSGGSHW